VSVHEGSCARPRRLAAALALTVAALAGSGCAEVTEESAKGYEPARVDPVKGTEDVKRVTLTAEGARRVGLRTAPVRRSGHDEVVPYHALIYDAEGRTFVYTTTRPLSFVRERVEVDRVVGPRAFLSRGPAAGTRVVTVGAAEVYGTELDVAGSH
jgi:hypothetical protein